MANSILTLQVLTNAFLHLLGRAVKPMGTAVYVDTPGARQGDTVNLREVPEFDPWGPNAPDFTKVFQPTCTIRPVVLQHQIRVGFELGSVDLTMSVDRFVRRHLENLAQRLALEVGIRWPEGADLVTAGLDVAGAVDQCKRSTDLDGGLSVRCVMQYDAARDLFLFRADMLFGFTQGAVLQYIPSPAEAEMIVLLLEARAELTQQLQAFKQAA